MSIDLVATLSGLAAELRTKAHGASEDAAVAYYDAATMVDAVNVGPVMQAILDQMDSEAT